MKRGLGKASLLFVHKVVPQVLSTKLCPNICCCNFTFSEWLGTGVVICLEQGADLHMAQLMPLPLTVSCSSKIQIGFTFLVPAYPGCPGKETVKWL